MKLNFSREDRLRIRKEYEDVISVLGGTATELLLLDDLATLEKELEELLKQVVKWEEWAVSSFLHRPKPWGMGP